MKVKEIIMEYVRIARSLDAKYAEKTSTNVSNVKTTNWFKMIQNAKQPATVGSEKKDSFAKLA